MGWNASFRHRQAEPSSAGRASVPKTKKTLFRKLASLAKRKSRQPELSDEATLSHAAAAGETTTTVEAAPRAPLVVHIEARFPGSDVLPEPCIYSREYNSSPDFVPSERLCKGLLRRIDHCSRELITRKDVKALLPQRRHGQLCSAKPLRYELRYRIIRQDGSVWADKVYTSYQKQEVTRASTGGVILAIHRIVGLFLCRYDPSFKWAELPTGAPSYLFKPQSSGSELSHTAVGNPIPLSCVPEARFLDASQSFEAIPGYSIHFSFRSHSRTRSEVEWKRNITLQSLQTAPLNLPLAEDLLWRSFDSVNNALEGRRAVFFHENAAEDLRDGVDNLSFDEDALDIELRISNNLGPDYDHLTRSIRSKLGLFQHPDARDCNDFVQSVQNNLLRFRDFADGQIGALPDFDLRVLTLHGLGWYTDAPARFALNHMTTYPRDTIEALLERIQTGITHVLRGSDTSIHIVAHKRGHLVFDEVMVIRSHQATLLPPSYTVDDQMKETVARLKRRIQQDLDAICRDTCSIDDIPEDPISGVVVTESATAAARVYTGNVSVRELAPLQRVPSVRPISPRVVELPDDLVFDGTNSARTSSITSKRRRAFPLIPDRFSLSSSTNTSIAATATPRQSCENFHTDVGSDVDSEPEPCDEEVVQPITEVLQEFEDHIDYETTATAQEPVELEVTKSPVPEATDLSSRPEPGVMVHLSTTVQPVTDWLPIWEESSIVEPEGLPQAHHGQESMTAAKSDVVEDTKSEKEIDASITPVEEAKNDEILSENLTSVALLPLGSCPEDGDAGLESHVETEPLIWLQSSESASAPQDNMTIAQAELFKPESPTLPEQSGMSDLEAEISVDPKVSELIGDSGFPPVMEMVVGSSVGQSAEPTLESVVDITEKPTINELPGEELVNELITCDVSVSSEVYRSGEESEAKPVYEEDVSTKSLLHTAVDTQEELAPSEISVTVEKVAYESTIRYNELTSHEDTTSREGPTVNEELVVLERPPVLETVTSDEQAVFDEHILIHLPAYELHHDESATDEARGVDETKFDELVTEEPVVQEPTEPAVESAVDLVAESALEPEAAADLVDDATRPTTAEESSVDAASTTRALYFEPVFIIEEPATPPRPSTRDESVRGSAVSMTEESDISRPSTPSLSSGAGNSRRPSLLETPQMTRTLSSVRTPVILGSDLETDVSSRDESNTDTPFLNDNTGGVRKLLDYTPPPRPILVKCEEPSEAASTLSEVPLDHVAASTLCVESSEIEATHQPLSEDVVADSANKLEYRNFGILDSTFGEEFSRTKPTLDLDVVTDPDLDLDDETDVRDIELTQDNGEESLEDEYETADVSLPEEPVSIALGEDEEEERPKQAVDTSALSELSESHFEEAVSISASETTAAQESETELDASSSPVLTEPEIDLDQAQEAGEVEYLEQDVDRSQDSHEAESEEIQQSENGQSPDNDQVLLDGDLPDLKPEQMEEPEPSMPVTDKDETLKAVQDPVKDEPEEEANSGEVEQLPEPETTTVVVVAEETTAAEPALSSLEPEAEVSDEQQLEKAAAVEVDDIREEPVITEASEKSVLPLEVARESTASVALISPTRVVSETSSWEDVETEADSDVKHPDADYTTRDSVDSVDSIDDGLDDAEELDKVPMLLGQRRMLSMPTAGFIGLHESRLVEVGIRGALTGSHAFDRAASRVDEADREDEEDEKTTRPQTPMQSESSSMRASWLEEGHSSPGKTTPRSQGKIVHRRTKSGSYSRVAFMLPKTPKRARAPSHGRVPVKLIATQSSPVSVPSSPTTPVAAAVVGLPAEQAPDKNEGYLPRVMMMLAGVPMMSQFMGKTAP
ncbi:pt repeat family protein [Grosmannia clavigera kw1407]|uniref:Pt repeat family protein n=1 Tax=Grosmannia clavigera (strain kw1407 / UAMH 11150) TaxID=655863 RepID=F0XKJ2_GROCL|nr:pt repeat family protein [Grosmannia clavigera kw1407]EFX01619.1 pt repeat family protein [Grosmannia clavigera kw1407]